jgi:hypothetical protein
MCLDIWNLDELSEIYNEIEKNPIYLENLNQINFNFEYNQFE